MDPYNSGIMKCNTFFPSLKQGYEGDVILIIATSDLLEARLIQQQ